MLLDFSIANFRSFSSVQTLDFRSSGLVSECKGIDQNNIVEKGGQKVLKTVGLYGPNGSGKSNLIQGLRLFRNLVQNSLSSEAVMDFASDPFVLSAEGPEHAGFFQIQLLIDAKKYRYGFTLSKNATVLEEWLFGPAEKNETYYFKRAEGKVDCNKEWFEEGYSPPVDSLRPNTLFLTFVSAYNGQISQAVRSFIVKNISFEHTGRGRGTVQRISIKTSNLLSTSSAQRQPTNLLLKEGKRELVLDWLKSAGLFYSNISFDEAGSGFERVLVEKNIFDKDGNVSGKVELDLDDNESAGTKKFYYYIGTLVQLFTEGGLLVSDEIDNNFHPSLLKQFLSFFNDPAINKAGAQLLFTSHDTNLLAPEVLRRDQIFFTEKSLKDETILYSLSDLKGIRNNADFARQYLAGFYGALPLLEKFKYLPTGSAEQ